MLYRSLIGSIALVTVLGMAMADAQAAFLHRVAWKMENPPKSN